MMEENDTNREERPTRNGFGMFGTLLLGMIIGGALVAGLGNFGGGRSTAPTAEPVSIEAVRQAAYEGAQAGALAAGRANPAQPAAAVGPTAEPVFEVQHRAPNSQGNADAPVVIVEYSDFECGYCKRFYDTTLKQIIDTYVAEGKVQLSYKHFPFLADSSLPKAIAAECAAEQGKFWQMHNALFTGRVPAGTDAEVAAAATQITGELGMDAAKFARCMKDDTVRTRVLADADEGQRVGVRGTPSFLVNGKLLVGAQPFAAFRMAIEQAMKN
jgi:protein-disulfide isomerase